ncbi:Zinc finger, C3HC4 type (RING finger) protein [Ceratobasidium theobromae]|uniref:RING-type E3 ubiquitin transferase n=1 Tax=Ceratobasidium theobromae TaxID=1582974 RepID=A0A5N5QEI2_9AGAM|nr:Zinc finger, C3HC4 type (RING finger) protein [Ceratobasidium theobromae]
MSTPGPLDRVRIPKDGNINDQEPHTEESISLETLKAKARERLAAEIDVEPEELASEGDEDHCIICLQPIIDRTVLIHCAHDRMCFVCIKKWSEQSRRCPLCNTAIGSHLIHQIRSQFDYQKYYLSPLPTSPHSNTIVVEARAAHRTRARRALTDEEQEQDELDQAIEKRRWVYRHGLFAKHIASNAHTRFRPNPTPQQISNSPELQSRCQIFVRRELRVWPNLDVEFLTSFILSLVKSIDIRTEAAVKLIGEFLDLSGRRSPSGGTIAEHFVHELYSYLRSPFRELPTYDAVAQYDAPHDIEEAPSLRRPSQQGDPRPSRDDDHASHSSHNSLRSRNKGTTSKRDMGNPLEASPRDWRADYSSDSDMDIDDSWAGPLPSNIKGKGRAREDDWEDRGYDRLRREHKSRNRRSERDYDRFERDYNRQGNRASGSKYSERSQDCSDRGDRTRYHNDRGSRRRERSMERNPEVTSGSHSDRRSRRPRDETRDKNRPSWNKKRPAGWDNFFENDIRCKSRHNPSESSSSPQDSCRPRDMGASRERSASRSSTRNLPDHRNQSTSPPPKGVRGANAAVYVESLNLSELERTAPHSSEDVARLHQPSPPGSQPTSASTESSGDARSITLGISTQPSISMKPSSQNRLPCMTPLASIRLHLQQASRSLDLIPPTHATDTGTPGATDFPILPTLPGKAIEAPSSKRPRTPSLKDSPTRSYTDPNPSNNLSTPNISRPILDAATRSKLESRLVAATRTLTAVTPERKRLLERLEAAKSIGAGNTPHPIAQSPNASTRLEAPEASVSDTQDPIAQETRLKHAAKNHLARNNTSRSAHDASDSREIGHAPGDLVDPDSPAARLEAEHRLKLHARLSVRKRGNIAVISVSLSDTPSNPR